MKAIVPAAGLGTRFLPVTKAQPKEMLPVVDKPVIQYVVEEAVAAGCDDILVVTGRGKRAIEDHFDRSMELEDELERAGNRDKLRLMRSISEMAEVFYVRQKRPRGLGHAVMCGARHVGDEPFFVLLGDVLVPGNDCLPRLMDVYQRHGGCVLAVQRVEPHMVSRYGVIAGTEIEPGVFEVSDLVEKPPVNQAPSDLAIFGRYLLTPAVMEVLPKIEPGRGDEIQLTDALREVVRRGEPMHAVEITCPGYDTGNVLAWLEANIALALQREEFGAELRAALQRMCE